MFLLLAIGFPLRSYFSPQANPLRDDGKHIETYRTVPLGQMYILIRGRVGIQTTSRRSSLGGGVRTVDLPRMSIILCKLYAFLHFSFIQHTLIEHLLH